MALAPLVFLVSFLFFAPLAAHFQPFPGDGDDVPPVDQPRRKPHEFGSDHYVPFVGPTQDLDVPYVRPTGRVFEFIALGDSFTAGVGCNGDNERLGDSADRGVRSYPMQMYKDVNMWQVINGARKRPRFTFAAHVTDKFHNILEDQISHEGWYQEKNWNRARNIHFGHPQVAVMTVGGNDALFANVLNNCVYRMWFPMNCNETLAMIKVRLDDGTLEERIRDVMLAVVRQGRKARGARPPESFQLFVPEYVSYFNEESRQCDRIDWHFHQTPTAGKRPLTRLLRERLNEIIKQYNQATKRAAEGLKDYGVFFVDDINPYYDGHRYCEWGQTSYEMDHIDTWFWSAWTRSDTTSEGRLPGRSKSRWKPSRPERRDTTTANNFQAKRAHEAQVLLNFVFGNQSTNETLLNSGTEPWTWPGAEEYPTFLKLIEAMQQSAAAQSGQQGFPGGLNPDGSLKPSDITFQEVEDIVKDRIKKFLEDIFLPFRYLRSFHPKATGHEVIKERIFAAMLRNREIVWKNVTVVKQRLTDPVILKGSG